MAPDWPLERFRSLLRLQVMMMRLDPRFQRRFDASDLVQETMLRALQHRDQFRGGSEAEALGWLQAILRNVVADKLDEAHADKRAINREQSIRAVADSSARIEALLADRGPSPSEAAARQEELLRMAGAIDRLPPDQRDVLIHHHLLGTPVAEIAQSMGRSEQAVAGLLFRGRRALADLLGDDN
jgi:RNA polymerase sigma-70 factor (ECF subfamily)